MAVQAHFVPHGAKTLDSARSKNVLVGMAGTPLPSLLHFCYCPWPSWGAPPSHVRQPKQGKDHFQGDQSGLPTSGQMGVCVWRWRTSLELVPLISTKLGMVARPCPPGSLFRCLPSSSLPPSGASGPPVSASRGPVIPVRWQLRCWLLRGPFLGFAAPLLSS